MGTRAGQKFMYFRTEADEDDDDDSAASAVFPATSFKGIHPLSDTAITLWFEPQIRVEGYGANASGNWINNDSVVLNITAGKTSEVMQAIIQAINGNNYGDGWLVIADDSTVEVGGSADSKTVSYLHSDITSCGVIRVGPAFAD